jgi:hypothetical protein
MGRMCNCDSVLVWTENKRQTEKTWVDYQDLSHGMLLSTNSAGMTVLAAEQPLPEQVVQLPSHMRKFSNLHMRKCVRSFLTRT